MLRVSPRIFIVTCASVVAFAGTAAAQRAPITYSGSDGASPATVSEALGLAGGGERSYGYGAQQRASARQPAVIDLRRPSGVRVQRVADFQPVAATEDDTDHAAEAQSAPSTPAPQAAPAEQGAQPWLERERVGPPYQANGQWYVPTPEPGYEQTGTASWYGPTFNGGRTASGEAFDQTAMTAAHPTLPIPSLVQVTNLENGREVIVRVNDRGPFVGGRVMDVSQGAAQVLGFEQAGRARVHIRYLGPAPRHVNADGSNAPATQNAPAAAAPRSEAEEGPASLLPPSSTTPALAGGPADQVLSPAPASTQYAAAPSGSFFVQVGAYSDLGNAQRVRDAVGAAGPVAVDTRQTSSGAELFRVRVGPWANQEEADAARRTVASLGYSDAVVAVR
jgi:rare lipoprotein A